MGAVLKLRRPIFVILAAYLATSSLFFLGPPRIASVRVRRVGTGFLLFGVRIWPTLARQTRVGVGLMIPFRLTGTDDPRQVMRTTEVTVDTGRVPWDCEAGVVFWSGQGTRYVEYQTLTYGTEGGWNAAYSWPSEE